MGRMLREKRAEKSLKTDSFRGLFISRIDGIERRRTDGQMDSACSHVDGWSLSGTCGDREASD